MSGSIVRLTAHDGTPVEFVDEVKASGGLKDCYFHRTSATQCCFTVILLMQQAKSVLSVS